jgi:hypothetical protein
MFLVALFINSIFDKVIYEVCVRNVRMEKNRVFQLQIL